MSVIIIEVGKKGLGIYSPEAVAAPGDQVTIFNRTDCNIRMNDPNNVLSLTSEADTSINSYVIPPNKTVQFFVRAGKSDGIYGYSMFAMCGENYYEILRAINGTPRIIIVSS